eukprot:TRINITY_DN22751_c2_g1_i1.p1 TRINITY_DN22751_c2_g1~~TRINITY_DN22751_c2_g1_i1.p1  ORF type:complete len:832 (-),score=44.30 TRINITY_DN22751_c2_g1_i1:691-3186(-)
MSTGQHLRDKSKPQPQPQSQHPLLPNELHVLLVDNEQLTRSLASTLLQRCGYNVNMVGSVQEARKQVLHSNQSIQHNIQYDIILLDVVQQSMEGVQLLCDIKNSENKKLATTPVIMMSSNESASIVHECLKSGAEECIIKPLTRKEVQHLWKYVWKVRKNEDTEEPRSDVVGSKRARECDSVNNEDGSLSVQVMQKYMQPQIHVENLVDFGDQEITLAQIFREENSLLRNFESVVGAIVAITSVLEPRQQEGVIFTPTQVVFLSEGVKIVEEDSEVEGFESPEQLDGISKTAYYLALISHLMFVHCCLGFISDDEQLKLGKSFSQGQLLSIYDSTSKLRAAGQFILDLLNTKNVPMQSIQFVLQEFLQAIQTVSQDATKVSQIQSKIIQPGSCLEAEHELMLYYLQIMYNKLSSQLNQERSIQQQIDESLEHLQNACLTKELLEPQSKQVKPNSPQILNEALAEAQRRFQNVSQMQKLKSHVVDNAHLLQNKGIAEFTQDLYNFSQYGSMRVRAETRKLDISRPDCLPCGIGFDCCDEYFAVASTDKTVKIYNYEAFDNDSIQQHYPMDEIESRSKVSCVCWSPYLQTHMALSDHDGVISLWDVLRHQVIQLFEQHTKRVWQVDFCSSQPTMLASASNDGIVHIWNMYKSESVQSVKVSAQVCSVQFHPINCNIIAVGCTNNKAYQYDLRRLGCGPVTTVNGHERTVSYVRYVDSNKLVTSSTDSTAKLWDISESNKPRILQTYSDHVNVRNFVGCATTKQGLIAMGSEDSSVYVYSTAFPSRLASYQVQYKDVKLPQKQSPFISCVAWNQTKNTLMVGSSVGALHLMELI